MDIIMKFCKRHDVNIMVNYQLAGMYYDIWMTKNGKTIYHSITCEELELSEDNNKTILNHLNYTLNELKEGRGRNVGTGT